MEKFTIGEAVIGLYKGINYAGIVEDYTSGEYAVRTTIWREKKWWKPEELSHTQIKLVSDTTSIKKSRKSKSFENEEMLSTPDIEKELYAALTDLRTLDQNALALTPAATLELYSTMQYRLSRIQTTIALAVNEIAVFALK